MFPIKRGLWKRTDHGIVRTSKQEARMIKSVIRLVTLAMFSMALIGAPTVIPAFAAGGGGGGGEPPPDQTPASSTKSAPAKAKKKPAKQSSLDDRAFAQGYRAAYATIYDRNDYAAAIEQLKALGHDERPNVANLIGYSYRKLGDYKLSQVWYERALKADPNHVLTWQYYGLWQIEQGNREQAQYHLSRIAAICGTDCEHYRSLAAALDQPPGTGLVY
jgi:Tetratricopeptide repeat